MRRREEGGEIEREEGELMLPSINKFNNDEMLD
jgi:hypothetical protein